MSAVLGETNYQSTGFNNNNLVFSQFYCAGCNGSFKLDFTSTSLSTTSGVFGVALDILGNSFLPYTAFITFGDNTTSNIALAGVSFFGITSQSSIKTIDFGLPNGGTTTQGSFVIDNLTIANSATNVPESTTILGSLTALGFGTLFKKRRSSEVNN